MAVQDLDDRDEEDLAEEEVMLREEDDPIDSHDRDLVAEKLLMVHLHQREDCRHLVQIDQPMLREHDDRDDDQDLVEGVRA